jgi:hypothetical protein
MQLSEYYSCLFNNSDSVDDNGFWQWCRILPITRNSKYLEKTTFWKFDLFLSSDEGSETPTVLGSIGRCESKLRSFSQGTKRVRFEIFTVVTTKVSSSET